MTVCIFSKGRLKPLNPSNGIYSCRRDVTDGTAIFFDRDGIVNEETGYAHIFESSFIYPEYINWLNFLVENGVKTGIATNQSGITRGIFSWTDFEIFHRKLDEFQRNLGLPENDVIACSWHPDLDVGRSLSNWRKPGPNMLLLLCCMKRVKPKNCVFIGDKMSDVYAAVNAGFKSVLKIDDKACFSSEVHEKTEVFILSRAEVFDFMHRTITREN